MEFQNLEQNERATSISRMTNVDLKKNMWSLFNIQYLPIQCNIIMFIIIFFLVLVSERFSKMYQDGKWCSMAGIIIFFFKIGLLLLLLLVSQMIYTKNVKNIASTFFFFNFNIQQTNDIYFLCIDTSLGSRYLTFSINDTCPHYRVGNI